MRVSMHFGRWGAGKTRTGIGKEEGRERRWRRTSRTSGSSSPLPPLPPLQPKPKTKTTPTPADLDAHLRLTVLTLGVLYHTHHGNARDQRGRVHALFDGGFFAKGAKGWVEVSFLFSVFVFIISFGLVFLYFRLFSAFSYGLCDVLGC